MEFVLNLVLKSLGQVLLSWQHNWPYLAVSVCIAALLRLYVNADKVAAFLKRYRAAGVVAATAAAVATPLCSCGTTAVILGMMASSMPWAPIVAFMVSSPLTSPEGLVYSAGLFGWPFALVFYLASIILGLVGGWLATVLESRGWLADQARLGEPKSTACACAAPRPAHLAPLPLLKPQRPGTTLGYVGAIDGRAGAVLAAPSTCCGRSPAGSARAARKPSSGRASEGTGPAATATETVLPTSKVTWTAIARELFRSARHLVLMFTGFAFVGYCLNGLIPANWVRAVFGRGNIYNVPLAATLGLPLYINAEASLPLIRTLLDAGMSQGAALAFMIAGAGTSVGAIAGALTIARWRVIALVVSVLWVGAMLCGYAYNLVLTWGLV